MKWRGRRQSSNIEDRRGQSSGGFGGSYGGGQRMRIPVGRVRGGGIGGIVLIVVLFFGAMALGLDPIALLNGTVEPSNSGSGYTQTTNPGPTRTQAHDDMTRFVSVVVGDTETFWSKIFANNGKTYVPPKVVLFSGTSPSGCGQANAATGPFYCPTDRKVYIDLSFYDALRQKFGAGGDFAEAYVLAHEIGHHIQNLTGVLPAFNKARLGMTKTEANAYSVRVELQADCYAGVWAHYEGTKGYLDPGDIEEALNAASKIGDDTLQKQAQGYVVPDSFTHGTSAERVRWFRTGQQSGNPGACDTFSAKTL